jgi:SAM-dependent methyltransferase
MVNTHVFLRTRFLVPVALAAVLGAPALAQQGAQPFEPVVGQAGKDVVWVPTPEAMVEKMLDVAKVTPQDFVMDLGSGDGRNVIAAAKRGARGLGVEYNQDMVDLSRRYAAEAGVAELAQFVQGDMYEADISKATVLALFLLPANLSTLRPKFLELPPGSRIVANTFGIDGWDPESTETIPNCSAWCTVMLYLVPVNAAGSWQLSQGMLTLTQEVQQLTGTLGSTPITEGKVSYDTVSFMAGDGRYTARVKGDTMEGTVVLAGQESRFRATRTARVAAAQP